MRTKIICKVNIKAQKKHLHNANIIFVHKITTNRSTVSQNKIDAYWLTQSKK